MDGLTQVIKDEIYRQYGSVLKFAKHIDVPASTVNSTLKNGIENTSAQIVFKILNTLNISSELFINVGSDKIAKALIEMSKQSI